MSLDFPSVRPSAYFGSSRPPEKQTPPEGVQPTASVNRIRYETDSRPLKRLGGEMLKQAVAAGILQKDDNDDILPGLPVNGYGIGWVDLDSQTRDRPCIIVMLFSDEGKRSYLEYMREQTMPAAVISQFEGVPTGEQIPQQLVDAGILQKEPSETPQSVYRYKDALVTFEYTGVAVAG